MNWLNWLQDNPVGKALVYASGALLVVAVVMTIAWSLPVKAVPEEPAQEGVAEAAAPRVVAREIASLNELEIINQRPLFNESRLPEAEDDVDGAGGLLDSSIEAKGAPDVRLTGVIITAQVKIATLTPAAGGKESVMAREGEGLIGEYVGWSVAEVGPRSVLLRSNDGQRLELQLEVHDAAIKEPPRPVAAAKPVQEAVAQAAAQAAAAQAVAEDNTPPPAGDEEQLSRAEQIRQRIAERREQLRLEQEARETQLSREREPSEGRTSTAANRTGYQNAIRDLMKGGRKTDETKEDNDG